MSYSARNTLVLVIILILTISVTFTYNWYATKQLSTLQGKQETLAQQLHSMIKKNTRDDDGDAILAELEYLKKNTNEQGKFVLKEENSALTFKYLDTLCREFCPSVDFNYKVSPHNEEETVKNNLYTISGNSRMKDFYTFLHHIENQAVLYTIESAEYYHYGSAEQDDRKGYGSRSLAPDNQRIGDSAGTKNNHVSFTLQLQGYQKDSGTRLENINLKKNNQARVKYNCFKPLIHAPTEQSPDRIDIEKVQLIGLTQNQIFVQDADENTYTLVPGDKVAWGHLSRINTKKAYALFKINKIGIVKEKRLYMEKE